MTANPDPYQQGVDAGEVRATRCNACGYTWLPGRWLCPECLSEDVGWQAMSGRGSVESFVWYLEHLPPAPPDAPDPPYNVALVRLEEGPRLLANVDGVSFGELAVGDEVTARFVRAADGSAVLRFAR